MEGPSVRRFFHLASILSLAIAYFFAGKLSLDLALVHPQASAVWPPTGIALAALLLGRYRLWPGILLGAFLVNVTAGDPGSARTFAAAGIAIGNTLEALVGAYLVRRFVSASNPFDSAPRVFAFIAAVTASTTVSATCGIASLSLAGLAEWDAAVWRHWWIGDLAGAIVFTPLLVLIAKDPSWRWGRGRLFEAGVLFFAACLLPLAAFTRVLMPQPHLGLAFLCIPPLLWAAFRFGQREVAVTMLPISVIGIWGTLHQGLTAAGLPVERVLLEFQVYMGVMSAMFLAVAAEVAHRKRYERTLEDRNKTLRQQAKVVDLAPLIVCDLDGRIIRWNSGAERLYGFAAPEAVGQISHELLHTSFPEPLEQIRAKLMREGNWQGELRQRTQAGQEVVVASLQLLHRDTQSGLATILEVHNDISELKRVEHERLHLAKIVETSGDAIVSQSLDGEIRSWNAGAERLFGYSAAEAIGQPIDLIIPADFRDEEREILERLRQGQRVDHRDTVRIAKDGRRIDLSVAISPLRDEQGRIVGVSKVGRDITERRRSEQAQRESEARFRLVADAAPVLIWVSDQNQKGIFFNERWLAFTGRALEQELGDGWQQGIHPQDVDRTVAARLHAFEAQEPFRVEFRMRRADGEYRWVLDHGVPRFTEAGALAGYIGSCIDLTERHDAEKALVESRQRLRLALEAGRMGAWEWSIETNEVVWSPSLEAIHGLLPGTFPGTFEAYWNDVHPEDRHKIEESIGRTLESGEDHHIQYRIKWPDDSLHFLEARGKLVKDEAGKPVLMIGVCVDITARKLAEEALLESEKRFRALADSAPVLIWINGLQGCEFVNRAYLDYLRIEPADVMDFKWDQFVHPEDRDRYLNAYSAAFAKQESFTEQFRFRRFDGEYRWMKSVGLPRFSGSGDFQGYVGSTLDITDMKDAEERLREDDRRKDEFLAVLAHELRNPLAALCNGLEVMKLLDADAQLDEIRGMMERQSGQLVAMVDDLLEISRITRGKLDLHKTRVTLADIVESAIESARPAIDEARHHLSVDIPVEKLEMEGDPHRLAQIVSNLLNNAARYTPQGGRITLTLQRNGEHALLSVSDSGIGIPALMQKTIFDMFAQIEHPLDRGMGGLGVGLALAKTLAEMHGGTISVHSEGAGKGSEFRVRLPLVDAAADEAAVESHGDLAGRIARRVLIVDDNEDAAQMLHLLIEALGSDVRTAADGLQAIEIAPDFLPEIVFLDLGMPRMNGYDAARHIRRQSWGKDMTLVALTGWGQEEDRQRVRQAGFDHHLVKPASFEQLRELLVGLKERTPG